MAKRVPSYAVLGRRAPYIVGGAEAATLLPFVSAAALPTLVLAVAISGPWSDRVGRRKPFAVAPALAVLPIRSVR